MFGRGDKFLRQTGAFVTHQYCNRPGHVDIVQAHHALATRHQRQRLARMILCVRDHIGAFHDVQQEMRALRGAQYLGGPRKRGGPGQQDFRDTGRGRSAQQRAHVAGVLNVLQHQHARVLRRDMSLGGSRHGHDKCGRIQAGRFGHQFVRKDIHEMR